MRNELQAATLSDWAEGLMGLLPPFFLFFFRNTLCFSHQETEEGNFFFFYQLARQSHPAALCSNCSSFFDINTAVLTRPITEPTHRARWKANRGEGFSSDSLSTVLLDQDLHFVPTFRSVCLVPLIRRTPWSCIPTVM